MLEFFFREEEKKNLQSKSRCVLIQIFKIESTKNEIATDLIVNEINVKLEDDITCARRFVFTFIYQINYNSCDRYSEAVFSITCDANIAIISNKSSESLVEI